MSLRQRALSILEFDKVRERLAAFTSFSLGKDLARALTPAYTHAEVTRLHGETSDACRLIELRPALSLAGAHDIRHMVRTAGLEGSLPGGDLLQIAATLSVFHSVRANVTRLSDELPTLGSLAAGMGEFREIERVVKQTINSSGEVVENASALLARLRAEERAAQGRLHSRLRDIIASPEGGRLLQEPFVTQRGDRFVLAVKAEHRSQFQGLIHDVSSSGATVFMEPLAIVELGNAWRELRLAEEREVQRILRELSAMIGAPSDAILESLDRLARIDLVMAKARMGKEMGGNLARLAGSENTRSVDPQDNGSHDTVHLINARHPLLTGDVVPVSVKIGKEFQALVISGPNTGGKTVALKAIGLLALMSQAGMPIPADPGSAFEVFDGVFADIGDEQSIQQSLSTFSGHMATVVQVLREATNRSLVLLDELGAGTDPQEGSAIARAILSNLVRRRATSIVTTHHSELKAFAHSAEGIENASVEFDSETLAPTFRLIVGVPGRSNAMAIAQRLGLPKEVLDQAKASLDQSSVEVEALLEDMQDHRAKAEEETAALQQARRELEEAKAALTQRREESERELNTSVVEHRVEVQVMAEEMRSRLRQTARRMNRLVGEKDRQELAELTAEVDGIRQRLEEGPWDVTVEKESEPQEPLAVGDTVLVEGVAPVATVITVTDSSKYLLVQAGQVRLRVHRDRIRGKTTQRAASGENITVSREIRSRAPVGDEFSVHGMRAQPAADAVSEYIEQAVLAGHHRVRIVHGKGRGVLRSVIQQALKGHPLVNQFSDSDPREGGEGVTVVDL